MGKKKVISGIVALSMAFALTGCVSQKDYDELNQRLDELEVHLDYQLSHISSQLDELPEKLPANMKEDASTENNSFEDNNALGNGSTLVVSDSTELPSYVSNSGTQTFTLEQFNETLERVRDEKIFIDDGLMTLTVQRIGYTPGLMDSPDVISVTFSVENHLGQTLRFDDLVTDVQLVQNGYCLDYIKTEMDFTDEFPPNTPRAITLYFESIDRGSDTIIHVLYKDLNNSYWGYCQVYPSYDSRGR